MNMDGTALYEAIAAIFVAQAVGIDLSVAQQVIAFGPIGPKIEAVEDRHKLGEAVDHLLA